MGVRCFGGCFVMMFVVIWCVGYVMRWVIGNDGESGSNCCEFCSKVWSGVGW